MFTGEKMNLRYTFACLKKSRHLTAALCTLALSGVYASASPITFVGHDIVTTTTSAHPNSSAAAASFFTAASAIGTVSTITFESAPLGSFSSLTAAPGVIVTGTDINGNNQTIRNTSNSPAFPTLDGFNTTPGGANFIEVQAGTVTFTFATPTQFFGAYLTGVQNFFPDEDITFSDGTSEFIDVPESGTSGSVGAVDFVGFTDAGKSISSITIDAGSANTGADYIGIDDVSYQSATNTTSSVTPEPDSIVLVLTGCLGLAAGIRRRLFV
jgi:hypothetical protein